MSGFVRPAEWLRQLFTSSQTGPVNPTEVSDDVSLVQPYDGGGYPLFNPGQWGVEKTSAAGASGSTDVYTVPQGKIARILAMSAFVTAGAAPLASAFVRTPTAKDTSVAPFTASLDVLIYTSIDLRTPILGPGHVLFGHHKGGDVLTVVRFGVYLCEVPIGTVFYV